MLVHQHLFGEHRQVEGLVQNLALPLQPPSGTGQQFDFGVFAEVGVAGGALRALAAEHRQAGDDVVAGLDVGDVFAYRFDHRRALMPEHGRGRVGIQPFHEMQVGVAKAGIGGAQQHFAPLRLFDLHILDGQRLMRCVKDRCFHVGSLRFLDRGNPSRDGLGRQCSPWSAWQAFPPQWMRHWSLPGRYIFPPPIEPSRDMEPIPHAAVCDHDIEPLPMVPSRDIEPPCMSFMVPEPLCEPIVPLVESDMDPLNACPLLAALIALVVQLIHGSALRQITPAHGA